MTPKLNCRYIQPIQGSWVCTGHPIATHHARRGGFTLRPGRDTHTHCNCKLSQVGNGRGYLPVLSKPCPPCPPNYNNCCFFNQHQFQLAKALLNDGRPPIGPWLRHTQLYGTNFLSLAMTHEHCNERDGGCQSLYPCRRFNLQ